MPRSTLRITILLIFTLIVGSFFLYDAWRRNSGAEDILSFQGVSVCSTDRDAHPGRHSCPAEQQFITSCAEAKAAVSALDGVTLTAQAGSLTDQTASCELKAINPDQNLYAFLVHAYTSADPAQALDQLYTTYTNLYQFPSLTTSSLTPDPASPLGSLHPLTPAFLIQGEPGFRMSVMTEDENGVLHPGAGTLIRMSCGQASDTMVAEPNGNSWFSFAGYDKLHCQGQPLQAQVIVQRDASGNWLPDTPTYSYLYSPDVTTLDIQNRPQDPQVNFRGKWQGIGAEVRVINQTSVDSPAQSQPLAGTSVIFLCEQSTPVPSPSEYLKPLEQQTDATGRVRMALADAQQELQGCDSNHFQVTLSRYQPSANNSSSSDPANTYYFQKSGPIAAAQISGSSFSGGQLEGQELELGGTVQLSPVGSIPGGYLTGSTICLFYTSDTARKTAGCPTDSSDSALVTRADSSGRYLFGADPNHRISYARYLQSGRQTPVVRIVNYTNTAYPAKVIERAGSPLELTSLDRRNITLPSDENALHDHVCLAVVRTWNTDKECSPLFNIITNESHWDVAARNPSSGASGLFQANPREKYEETALPGESAEAIGNQIRWGVQYVKGRYGTPSSAWRHWQANSSY